MSGRSIKERIISRARNISKENWGLIILFLLLLVLFVAVLSAGLSHNA